jgi:hypothetical protein
MKIGDPLSLDEKETDDAWQKEVEASGALDI